VKNWVVHSKRNSSSGNNRISGGAYEFQYVEPVGDLYQQEGKSSQRLKLSLEYGKPTLQAMGIECVQSTEYGVQSTIWAIPPLATLRQQIVTKMEHDWFKLKLEATFNLIKPTIGDMTSPGFLLFQIYKLPGGKQAVSLAITLNQREDFHWLF
jgi:hypothetical protein